MASASAQRPPLFIAPLPTNTGGRRQIERVLIANRGEIACRIISTCRKLNLTSIAIYVDEDARSRHVSEADEAICLGSISQDGGNPFLNIEYLVDVAKSARADAIHPGYGYLSENGMFADAVRKSGIIFVGPSSDAINTLGDKRQSKEHLRKHAPSIPLVPGFAGSSQNVEDLEAAAEKIGYPVMIKASAGGGGRGMRIVRERAQLKNELERAQSEAKRSFGSSDCILEKYIESSKHIEVQILGDSHGKVLSLWERECSVQRRHQKVIEETPSPFLTMEQRQRMCAAAVELGELILYEGAGTVEFVVDAKDGSFYFLEVNTRLQVEHPITEEVTGLDIVALQLFIAAGGSLSSLTQLNNIPQEGHSIECRLCAEDAAKNFMPESGKIELWTEAKLAQGSRDVRYETAVESGSSVSVYFDSMIAKIVVWAPTRDLAISKMQKIMANTACVGLTTNQLFLQSCLAHPAFQKPTYTTSLIADNLDVLLRNPYTAKMSLATNTLAAVPLLMMRLTDASSDARPFRSMRRSFKNQSFDPIDLSAIVVCAVNTGEDAQPILCSWQAPNDGNRTGPSTVTMVPLARSEATPSEKDKKSSMAMEITRSHTAVSKQLRHLASQSSARYSAELRKVQHNVNADTSAALVEAVINGSIVHAFVTPSTVAPLGLSSKSVHQSIKCHFPALGTWIEYQCFSMLSYFEKLRDDVAGTDAAEVSKTVRAPMPCKVLSVLKKDGEEVKAGEVVLVIESMKMETSITSGRDGLFRTSVKKGDAVDDGKVLCWFE